MRQILALFILFFGVQSQALAARNLSLIEHDYKSISEASQSIGAFSEILRAQKDRRALFAGIYSLTIATTEKRLRQGEFKNPIWIRDLIVNYANLYRRTLYFEMTGQRAKVPKGWQYEFRFTESSSQWTPDLDVVYGINVHITRDLVEALFVTPTNFKASSVRRDFLKITEALGEAMPGIWRLYNSYERWSLVPACFEKSVAYNWISYLRFQAWKRAAAAAHLSSTGKKTYLDRLDRWLVTEQHSYGMLLPILR